MKPIHILGCHGLVPCNADRGLLRVLLGAVFTVASSFADANAVSSDLAKPSIQIIDPLTIAPLVATEGTFVAGGPAVTRRVFSQSGNGPDLIDADYNTYRAGVTSPAVYAYTKDELCYLASGSIEMESDGVNVLAKPGIFFWRPAGAQTERTHVIEDSVSICSFAPARADAWSHLMAPEAIGKWTGAYWAKPHVHIFNVNNVPPDAFHSESAYRDGRVVERQIVSYRKDGILNADVTYTHYREGVSIRIRELKSDEICWLESGELAVTVAGAPQLLKTSFFMFRSAGAAADIMALDDSTELCWYGPARRDR